MIERIDQRLYDQIRPVEIIPNYTKHAEGSVLIIGGDTKVICTATVEEKIPPFLKGLNQGWLTAEYAMLPRSVEIRLPRDSVKGQVAARHQEIQRFIGRSLREAVNLSALGERTIILDCDVIQADGGTRTLAVTGAMVAVVSALLKVAKKEEIMSKLLKGLASAVSVGLVNGQLLLDLSYVEDKEAEVDLNLVMLDGAKIIEIQGTAEKRAFSIEELNAMVSMAQKGIKKLMEKQQEIIEGILKN